MRLWRPPAGSSSPERLRVDEEKDQAFGLTHRLLDQLFPLDRFSAEDRLRIILFHLRASAGADDGSFHDTATRVLGTPEPVVAAALQGDIPALVEALQHAGGWDTLASLLGYGQGLNADYGSLRAASSEYEDLALGTDQRRLLPLSHAMLQQRGYQHALETFQRELSEAAVNPRLATTPEELIEALKCLHLQAHRPSLREMAKRSEHVPEGMDPHKHQPRSHNTINKVLHDRSRLPRTVAVLAFVRGCRVTDPDELRAWEEACERIAITVRKARRTHRGRSSTGPNPSMA